jgi:hypothetical protein
MGHIRPMALACRSDPTGETAGWPAHAHGRAAWPVRLAGGLPVDEVDGESVAKLLASRRSW